MVKLTLDSVILCGFDLTFVFGLQWSMECGKNTSISQRLSFQLLLLQFLLALHSAYLFTWEPWGDLLKSCKMLRKFVLVDESVVGMHRYSSLKSVTRSTGPDKPCDGGDSWFEGWDSTIVGWHTSHFVINIDSRLGLRKMFYY